MELHTIRTVTSSMLEFRLRERFDHCISWCCKGQAVSKVVEKNSQEAPEGQLWLVCLWNGAVISLHAHCTIYTILYPKICTGAGYRQHQSSNFPSGSLLVNLHMLRIRVGVADYS